MVKVMEIVADDLLGSEVFKTVKLTKKFFTIIQNCNNFYVFNLISIKQSKLGYQLQWQFHY